MPQVWQHLLTMTPAQLVGEFDGLAVLRCEQACDAAQPAVRTLADLFHRPRPPAAALAALAGVAQAQLLEPTPGLPRVVLLALLNGSALLARAAHGANLVVELDLHQLVRRADWLAEQTWIDEATLIRFQQARDALGHAN